VEKLPAYDYPSRKLNERQLELAAGLSSSHAVGEIEPLDIDPEQYKAQGAWRMRTRPIQPEGLEYIAKDVYPRSDEVLEDLENGDQSARIHHIGRLLTAGHTVMNTIPHSNISEIGLALGLPVVALRKHGYDFRSGMVVSQGVTMLGREYHGHVVSVPDYLGFMCDTTWFVYPNTDKTANSELAREGPMEVLKEPNGLVKADMMMEQGRGGWFITSAVNATSYIRGRNGEHLLAGIKPGTIETMTSHGTRIQRLIVELMGREDPVFDFYGPPLTLYAAGEVHDQVGGAMATKLEEALPGQHFIYLDPRQGLTPAMFQ
jgi:hypothetical protein